MRIGYLFLVVLYVIWIGIFLNKNSIADRVVGLTPDVAEQQGMTAHEQFEKKRKIPEIARKIMITFCIISFIVLIVTYILLGHYLINQNLLWTVLFISCIFFIITFLGLTLNVYGGRTF